MKPEVGDYVVVTTRGSSWDQERGYVREQRDSALRNLVLFDRGDQGYFGDRELSVVESARSANGETVEEDVSASEAWIIAVTDEIKDLLLSKNRKYGNSALEPTRIFSKADNIEQIRVRIDDKLSRIVSAPENEDEDVINDLIGYLFLLKIALAQAPGSEEIVAGEVRILKPGDLVRQDSWRAGKYYKVDSIFNGKVWFSNENGSVYNASYDLDDNWIWQ